MPFTLGTSGMIWSLRSNFDGAPDLEFRIGERLSVWSAAWLSASRPTIASIRPRAQQQEEVYVVAGGSGRMKLDDEIVEVKKWDVVRVPPGTWRGYEAGAEGLRAARVWCAQSRPKSARRRRGSAGLVGRLIALRVSGGPQ